VEVLSVDVIVDVWLLVELVDIEVLNSDSYIINIKINWEWIAVPASLAFSTWNL
jgi:hypothetical protein